MKRRTLLLIVLGFLALCVVSCLVCTALGAVYNMTPQGKMTQTARAVLNEAATARAGSRATEAVLPKATLAAPTWTASPASTLAIRSMATVALGTNTMTPARPTAQPTKSVTLTPRPTPMATYGTDARSQRLLRSWGRAIATWVTMIARISARKERRRRVSTFAGEAQRIISGGLTVTIMTARSARACRDG